MGVERALSVAIVLLVATPVRADELQNDGFASGDTVSFQAGFGVGDIGASRFIAPEAGRQLLKVHLLFGGDTAQKTVTLKVWDDTAGTNTPGSELASSDFQLTGSDSALQELDVSGMNITLTQQFRVGLVFPYAGPPSIARDTDGTINADKNFILDTSAGWQQSSTFGLTGDWIIRAVISGTGNGGADAGVIGGSCNSNAECGTGTYCDLSAHTCTFDCRTAADCGEGTCNSLGMCVGGKSGGGCCESGRGSNLGGLVLGLGIFVLLRRRRA